MKEEVTKNDLKVLEIKLEEKIDKIANSVDDLAISIGLWMNQVDTRFIKLENRFDEMAIDISKIRGDMRTQTQRYNQLLEIVTP